MYYEEIKTIAIAFRIMYIALFIVFVVTATKQGGNHGRRNIEG